jgi:hypothetical protein
MEGRATLLAEFGKKVQHADICRRTGRVAVVQDNTESDLWRIPIGDGTGAPESAPVQVFGSTSYEEEARYSPDGKWVAFLSERSGSLQAYLAVADGGTPHRVSNFDNGEKGRTTWAPGNLLSVHVRIPGHGPEVHQIKAGSGESLKMVFSAPSEVQVVGVSRDGCSVFVDAGEGDTPRLERWRIRDGRREVVAAVKAAFVVESEDGRWLYFARRQESQGVFRVRARGGTPERIVERLTRRTSFAVRGPRMYFVSPEPEPGVYVKDLEGRRTKLIHRVGNFPGWGIDVSPDETQILLPLIEFDDADVMLAKGIP